MDVQMIAWGIPTAAAYFGCLSFHLSVQRRSSVVGPQSREIWWKSE
jgi:hypothetical protein